MSAVQVFSLVLGLALVATPSWALTVDQVIKLRRAGVSNQTIQQMIETEIKVKAAGGSGRYVLKTSSGNEWIVYQASSPRGVVEYPVPTTDATGPNVSGLATVLGAPRKVSQAAPHSKGSTKVTPSGGVWVVHLDSYQNQAYAQKRLAQLKAKGVDARLSQVDIPGKGQWNRVLVGSYKTKPQAQAQGQALQNAGTVKSYRVMKR